MISNKNISLTIVFILGLGAVFWLTSPAKQKTIKARLDFSEALQKGDTTGFARALLPRTFSFPQDHGPHKKYKIEWWYYVGNLETPEKRHFGYQLVFFRVGLRADPVKRESAWGTNHIYMAHFAVTDVKSQRFYNFERTSRAALGLAGAESARYHIWLEDWYAEEQGENALPMDLHAAQDTISIDLELNSDKPIILHGNQGLSQKSAKPGNASYYYSLTRMNTNGTIRIGPQIFHVTGLSWMDREWSTSALGGEQVGWDWFALQLSDGREVMFFQLRKRGGGIDRHSAGTIISPEGHKRSLAFSDVEIDVLGYWTSPVDGIRYPSKWQLRMPDAQLQCTITPYLQNQELNTATVRYWEGAVKIEGHEGPSPIEGNGYVELTGYGEEFKLLRDNR